MEYSGFSEAPDNFHYWTGVSVLAGALRRHVWIDMGYFQWTPCFYIVFVAPPGIVSKSTTANVGMNLLREISGVQFGPDAVTWQSLVQSLGQSAEAFEVAQDKLETMSAITIVSSEFGTFLNPNDREMVDVMVSLWDGQVGVWKKATKTSGKDEIVNPWINLIACTTPAWIQGNFPEYMIGGGFTSRTIFVYAEEKRRLVAYPKQELPENIQQIRASLIHDLEHISANLIGEFQMSASALSWGEQWYEKLYSTNKDSLANDRFAGYVARKQTHLHKLAMIISVSRGDSLTIEREDLIEADRRLEEAESNQDQVFSRIVAPEARPANLLYDTIRRSGSISHADLFTAVFRNISKSQFDEGIEGLIQSQMIVRHVRGNTPLYRISDGSPKDPLREISAA